MSNRPSKYFQDLTVECSTIWTHSTPFTDKNAAEAELIVKVPLINDKESIEGGGGSEVENDSGMW